MLGRDDDGVNPYRVAPLVILHRHLCLSIGEDVRDRAVLSLLHQQVCHLIRQRDRQGHQIRCLVTGVAEHHSLIPRSADSIVGSHCDVGALLVDSYHHRAGVAVKSRLGAVIADVLQDAAGDTGKVDVVLRADLAHDQHHAGRAAGLAGHTAIRVMLHDLVEHCVRDAVAHFIGMAFRDRFRSEEYLAHALNLLVVFPFRLDFLSPSDSPDFLCYTIIQVDGELQSRLLSINSCYSLFVSFPVFYSPIQVFKHAGGERFRRGSSTRSRPRRRPCRRTS